MMSTVEEKSMEQVIKEKVSEMTKGSVTFVHVSEIYDLERFVLKALNKNKQ